MGFFKWLKGDKKSKDTAKGETNENIEVSGSVKKSVQDADTLDEHTQELTSSEETIGEALQETLLEEINKYINNEVDEIRVKVTEELDEIKEKALNLKDEAKGIVEEKVYEIKEKVTEELTDIKDKVLNIKDEAQEVSEEKVTEIKEKVTEKVIEELDEIKEKVLNLKDEAREAVQEKIYSIKEEITEKVTEELADIKENTSSLKDELQEKIEAKVSEVTEEVSNEIKENINSVVDYIDKKKQDIPTLIGEIELEREVKAEPKKSGFFAKIKSGLAKTRENILSGVEQVLASFTKIDEELFEELEEALIMSDIGVETSLSIMSNVRDIVKREKVKDVSEIKDVIVKVITEILEDGAEEFSLKSPSVILVIGVNGVGKTTTIGKLTNYYKSEGKKVMLAAADTFRAAAIDQLKVWGDRNNVDVIRHQESSDPAAVVFDAIQASKARDIDVLICDTAGRLHNKKNLMEELKKIARIVNRENPDAQVETLLVLDATTGQNALQQAKLFSEVADITGLVLTKLDGTAKGGIVIAIKNEMKIPVRFIGIGEGLEDLRPFDAKEFAKALFE